MPRDNVPFSHGISNAGFVESLFFMEIIMKKLWDDQEVNNIISFLMENLRINSASSRKDHSLSAPRFVFICGKKPGRRKNKTVRNAVIDELSKKKCVIGSGYQTHSVLNVVSEALYIPEFSDDIFSFEKMLADISQKIIVVAESAGSFCELGAFAMDNNCMNKTIVINEDKKEYKDSFVTNGPIKMLENRDERNVILYNDRIENNSEFVSRMKEIASCDLIIPVNNNPQAISTKSLIYELANIVELFQPVTAYEVESLYKKIKKFDSYKIVNDCNNKLSSIKRVMKLMEFMKLIKKDEAKGTYRIASGISCYNAMFILTRKQFLNLKISYLNRYDKYR